MMDQKLTCLLCNKQFINDVNLTNHVVTFHSKECMNAGSKSICGIVNLGSENLEYITLEMLQKCLEDIVPLKSFISMIHFDNIHSEHMNFRYYRYRRICVMLNGEWEILPDTLAAQCVYENAFKHFIRITEQFNLDVPETITNIMPSSVRDGIIDICRLKTEKYKKLLFV